MRRMNMTVAAIVAALYCGSMWASQTYAAVPYQEGFEAVETGTDPYTGTTPPYDWSMSTDASTTAQINRVASGSGTLNLTAASGGYYAELTNGQSGYQTGYGDAGYDYLGGHAYGQYPGSAFYQSMAVYLNTGWAPATNAGTAAFWIDTTPSTQNDVGNGTSYDFSGGEHNFHVMSPSGGVIDIYADGQTNLVASVTQSGWYTFRTVYAKGGNDSDPSTATLSILDASNHSLGSVTLNNGTDPSSDLGGSGYEWVTLWQNGFANNTLGIDNIQTGVVPEPASLALLGLGGLLLMPRRRRSN